MADQRHRAREAMIDLQKEAFGATGQAGRAYVLPGSEARHDIGSTKHCRDQFYEHLQRPRHAYFVGLCPKRRLYGHFPYQDTIYAAAPRHYPADALASCAENSLTKMFSPKLNFLGSNGAEEGQVLAPPRNAGRKDDGPRHNSAPETVPRTSRKIP